VHYLSIRCPELSLEARSFPLRSTLPRPKATANWSWPDWVGRRRSGIPRRTKMLYMRP